MFAGPMIIRSHANLARSGTTLSHHLNEGVEDLTTWRRIEFVIEATSASSGVAEAPDAPYAVCNYPLPSGKAASSAETRPGDSTTRHSPQANIPVPVRSTRDRQGQCPSETAGNPVKHQIQQRARNGPAPGLANRLARRRSNVAVARRNLSRPGFLGIASPESFVSALSRIRSIR
jgi:hypothetical protein